MCGLLAPLELTARHAMLLGAAQWHACVERRVQVALQRNFSSPYVVCEVCGVQYKLLRCVRGVYEVQV